MQVNRLTLNDRDSTGMIDLHQRQHHRWWAMMNS
jgi:hypothetical protein